MLFFHDILLGPSTSVYHVKVIVVSAASGCDVTNCATTLQGFNKHIRIDLNHEYRISIHLWIDNNREYWISIHHRICSRSIRYFQSMNHQRSSYYAENRTLSEGNVMQQNYHREFVTHQNLFCLLTTLSFIALWKVASQTIFHFPADMISSNFRVA